ncbi:MAG: hypothetical protein DIZ80_06260 [endosymbiont of Galathealinum brachiosum]|uniref:Tetratricopeptide repeat protein n=1 Tax=endosymbiont of Galathealinum brachiosum TaxID=2200906 RepID=A0A370DGR1_9GAMM|nr:MAG: hypothetical protein DIZ80_06260 [endosymbiont of Galathealinum brachiosum]
MTSLLKKLIWLIIYLLPILALIYYRAFIFTADFNQPVDRVVNDFSHAIGFEIPSYKLANNEKSLYNKYVDDTAQANINSAPQNRNPRSFNNYSYPSSSGSSLTGGPGMQPQAAYMAEAKAPVDESDSGIDQIITAVKETMNETLESFVEENEQQSSSAESSMLNEKELLFKARLAYWNGDLKTAETTYIQLTEMAIDDPNAYGELGNLYYMQSKWKKASDAYYHAALKLNKANNAYQAQHLLRIIRGLDTETADKLQAELNQTS